VHHAASFILHRGGLVHQEPLAETSVETFFQVDIRVGRVVSAEPLPKACTPAHRLEIDFGPLGTRWSSAQLVALYTPEQLLGRLVLAVVNFPPRRIAGFESQVLVLGVPDEHGDVILLAVERDAPPGARVF
jgi:tRNA-binding protein